LVKYGKVRDQIGCIEVHFSFVFLHQRMALFCKNIYKQAQQNQRGCIINSLFHCFNIT
jgi:hypothetical protein